MRESLDEALEEIKRADHLLYVSLKYTRTVDVLLNVANRFIEAYDRLIETLLRLAKEEGKIEEIPIAPKERADLVKKTYAEDPKIKDNVELYELLRKIHKSNPQKEQEYRRHVTLRTFIEGREEMLNIDICEQYYNYIREFFEHVKEMVFEADKDNK